MKRILLTFFILLSMTLNSHAGLISISTLSNDSQVSYTYLNTSFNTIKNVINGGLDSDNIEDGSIGIDDMATAASPAQREGDHFNAYTKTGMLPATDTDLTSDISAGVSYVKSDAGLLYRIATDATAKTYTASKDTWVYIDSNGAFQYEEVANGAAQPSTPSNSLILAKVVTDGDNITSVVDQRTLSISLGTSEDFYIKGLRLLWDLATDRLSVDTGVVYIGTTRIAKTSVTGLNIGTAGDYTDGASDRGTDKQIYVYCDTDGNIKMNENVPNRHDTSGTTTGILYYYYDGAEYWRHIGEFYLNSTGSGNIAGFYDLDGKTVRLNSPVSITTTPSAALWSAALDCGDGIPATSVLGIFGLQSSQGSSGAGIWVRPNGSNWSTDNGNGIYVSAGGASAMTIGGERWCATDSSQQINYQNDTGDDGCAIDVEGYIRATR